MNRSTNRFLSATVAGCLSMHAPSWAQSALPDPLAAGWKGQTVCERLHEDANSRILRCVLPPNTGHERHFHPATYTYVLAGGKVRVTQESGTRELDIKTGAGSFSAGLEWHEVLNVGEQSLGFLLVETKSK